MFEPTWIRLDVVLAIHQRQLAEHGGSEGVRDYHLLESASARPLNLWSYSDPKPDLTALAAAYAFGITKNHAFVDGNKRTAFVTCLTFLRANGIGLEASAEEKYVMFLRLAEGRINEAELADWLRPRLREANSGDD